MFRKPALIGVLTVLVAACGGTAASATPEESEAAAATDAVPADARTVTLEIGAGAITPNVVVVK
jgi:uncharacterized cupredoxin-like copper-binding protein